MITIMTNCPPEESLRRIGTDNLSESTFATLERHVEECALCQKRLEWRAEYGRRADFPARYHVARCPSSQVWFSSANSAGAGRAWFIWLMNLRSAAMWR